MYREILIYHQFSGDTHGYPVVRHSQTNPDESRWMSLLVPNSVESARLNPNFETQTVASLSRSGCDRYLQYFGLDLDPQTHYSAVKFSMVLVFADLRFPKNNSLFVVVHLQI